MAVTDTLGIILLALGAACLFLGKIIEFFVRGRVDSKIEDKEEELNEASKNSASARAEYERLKREWDKQ